MEDPKRKKKFDREYEELLLSELILALMEKDEISVRKLAKAAKISPTVVQEIRSGKKANLTLLTLASIAEALGWEPFLTLKKKGEKSKSVPLHLLQKSKSKKASLK
jgi:DNA-binding Xre family transcriptional regulator